MDALALLCNLHADGPRTLQRLRRAGCESLVALFDIEPASLVPCFDGDAGALERFLREAELLSERLEESGLPPHAPLDVDSALEEDEDELEEFDEADDERLDRVLDAWRQLDRQDPPTPPSDYAPAPGAPAVQEIPLTEVAIDGLTPALIARFQDAGIRSLSALLSARPLDVADQVELSWTRLKRLQFLGRREAERRADAIRPVLPHASAAPELREAGSGASDRVGTGGPFV